MELKNRPPVPPREMIGPRIMCLSRLIRQAGNEAATEQGLFSGQHDIVLYLVENEGMTISELAKRLDVATATASVSVKRMEKAGFITKKPDKNDARIIRLYPTERAKSAPEAIKKKLDALDTTIKKNLTQEQIYELSSMLDTAIKNLLERGDDKC